VTNLIQDLRIALRGLARSPGFAAVAVFSLGTGIGAVTTIYNWTDRFLLSPLPLVPESDRLVQLLTRAPGGDLWSVSYPSFRDWAARNQVFEAVSVSSLEQVGVRFDQGVERAWATTTSDDFFDVMRVRAIHGRTFRPGEEAAAAPVVVLGHEFWERQFQSDPGVVGTTLVINGDGFEVIGVLPPKFGGAYVGLNLDLYLLVTTYPVLFDRNPLQARGSHFLDGVARLKPGMTLAHARDDMRRVGSELEAIYPDDANEAVVQPITAQGPPATMKPVFIALLGVTGLVLLIACANVANLLLARATSRQKEIGVRLALGAGRPRLIRLLLAESVLLALGGGLLGIALAFLGRDAIIALVPPTPFPVGMEFPLNGRVIGLAMAVSATTVAVFGLWPALRASRPDLVPVLKDVGTGSRKRSTSRAALVSAQTALTVVSLACAGLFLRAIQRSHRLDPGFRDPASLLLMDTDLRIAGLGDSAGPIVLDRALERIRAVPGVERAAAGTFVPLGWSCCSSTTVQIDGYTPQRDENMSVVYAVVTADYFETMGIDLLAGRSFTTQDRSDTEGVAIVNEAFVRRYWSGRSALGRQLVQSDRRLTVVGVARDGKYRQLTEAAFPLIYRPIGQRYSPWFTVHVRARGNPRALAETIRREVRAADADLPLLSARTMSESMMQSTIGQQIGSRTLAVFGSLALLLSAVGIYGVMAYAVSQRTREIGVRVALGAARRDIARMVLREGLRFTIIGLVAGGALAMGAGRLMAGLLLGVSPSDPVTFAAVTALLVLVAIAACLVPARRAAAIDPVRAFRAD
jgi:predicted permease